LQAWEGRIIETKKGVVRLFSISERARQLFGEVGTQAIADRIENSPEGSVQLTLFAGSEEGAVPEIKGRGRQKKGLLVSEELLKEHRGATTLDRVHAAMLLQAGGRANALQALLKAEQDRSPDFLRLANALSALYPKNSEEKRLLDAMLWPCQDRGQLMEITVKRIILKRFRSFPADHVDLDNPTFLVGKNGSGKSNFADVFSFLSDAMSSPLQAVFDKRGGISSVRNRTSGRSYPPNLGIGVDLGSLNDSIASGRFAFEIRRFLITALKFSASNAMLRHKKA